MTIKMALSSYYESCGGILKRLAWKARRPVELTASDRWAPQMSRPSPLALKNSSLRSIFKGKLQALACVSAGLKWESRRPVVDGDIQAKPAAPLGVRRWNGDRSMPTRTSLRLTLLAGLAAPLCAFALGVGPLNVRSALNENFEADIPLIVNNPGELNGLTVQIPLQQDFDKVGLERLAFFSKLRFTVEKPPGGPNRIKISSIEPIREPSFNLLLEVVWSRGRLLREFPVQVDPELYVNRYQPPPPLLPLPSPVVTAPPVAAPPPRPSVNLPPASPVSLEGASTYGPIKSGETLMAIANQVRPSTAISLPQMMSILLANNPGAFANNNPNVLRRGAMLQVPAAQALGVQGAAPPSTIAEVTPNPSATEPGAVLQSPEAVAPAASPPVTASPEAVSPAATPPLATPSTAVATSTTPLVPPGPPAVASTPPLMPPSTPGLTTPPSTVAPTTSSLGVQPPEIVPQASIPQTENAPPATGAPPPVAESLSAASAPTPVGVPSSSSTPTTPVSPSSVGAPSAVTEPKPETTPQPAPAPRIQPPAVVDEPSLMANPVVWIAVALIALAIAAVVLLPLLRRPAREKPAVKSVDFPTEPTPAASVRSQVHESPTRPLLKIPPPEPLSKANLAARAGAGAVAAAGAAAVVATAAPAATAAPESQSVADMLREIDFGVNDLPAEAGKGAASTIDRRTPLPDTEPATSPESRKPVAPLAASPAAELAQPNPLSAPQSDLPPGLRMDGFDFDFGNLNLQQTGSHSIELPPLELKPSASGQKLPNLPSGIDRPEPATEPPSVSAMSSILSAQGKADDRMAGNDLKPPTVKDDFALDFKPSALVDLPPLEMSASPPGRGSAVSRLPPGIDRPEPATEPAFSSLSDLLAEQSLIDGQTAPMKLKTPAATPDHKFQFTDISRDMEQQTGELSLELPRDLRDFGDQTLDLGKVEQPKQPAFGGGSADYVETKLDLATAYLDMGDQVGARGLLDEVMQEGDSSQKQRAIELLKKV